MPNVGNVVVMTKMLYTPEVRERLAYWRESDTTLYTQTVSVLNQIKTGPATYGQPGTPFVERLRSYQVPGRDDTYVITWQTDDGTTVVLSISSEEELIQRARYGLRDADE